VSKSLERTQVVEGMETIGTEIIEEGMETIEEGMETIEELAITRVSRHRRVIIPRKHYGD
jgi:hypothetical protein